MQFEAVHTTGIYCRAECSAKPLPRNVEQFPSAIAAEAAGFRPCLRCRPERLPASIGRGGPPVIEQAVLLISEGFLDRHTEEVLATRVGYSTRQLRRLFHQTVGASPNFVARSRRAHFARRLLDETDLSIDAISRAAGFTSTRQMNRVMQEIFHFTPTELRSRRSRKDRLAVDGGLHLRVPYAGPLDWTTLLEFLGRRAIPAVEHVSDGVYRRLTTTCGYPGVIEVTRRPEDDVLEVTAHLPTFNSIVDDVARIRWLFGLDQPSVPEAIAHDSDLYPIVQRHPGLRIPGAWDRFETAIRILVGQQVSVQAATTLAGRIVETYGEHFDVDAFGLSRQFPGPATLASATLDGLGMPRSRMEMIRTFSQAVAEGSLDLYDSGSLDTVTSTMQELPGIGPWTAQLIAHRVMRKADAFPASDLGLRIAIGHLIGEDRPPASVVEEYAERWRPHRAIAAQYLWASLNDKES